MRNKSFGASANNFEEPYNLCDIKKRNKINLRCFGLIQIEKSDRVPLVQKGMSRGSRTERVHCN